MSYSMGLNSRTIMKATSLINYYYKALSSRSDAEFAILRLDFSLYLRLYLEYLIPRAYHGYEQKDYRHNQHYDIPP